MREQGICEICGKENIVTKKWRKNNHVMIYKDGYKAGRDLSDGICLECLCDEYNFILNKFMIAKKKQKRLIAAATSVDFVNIRSELSWHNETSRLEGLSGDYISGKAYEDDDHFVCLKDKIKENKIYSFLTHRASVFFYIFVFVMIFESRDTLTEIIWLFLFPIILFCYREDERRKNDRINYVLSTPHISEVKNYIENKKEDSPQNKESITR